MAVTGAESASTAPGRPLAPPVLRLAVARAVLLALLSAPVFLVVFSAASSGPARSLYFTETARPLPAVTLVALFVELGGAFGAALAGSLVVALFLNQLLTAAALTLLDPRRASDRPALVRTVMFHDGLLQLWPFLRVALSALAIFGVGAGVLSAAARIVGKWGDAADWSGDALFFWRPLVQIVLTSGWALIVGAWALWARAFVVADGRRRVRRAGWLAFRTLLRHPVRGVVPFALMAVVTQLAGKAAVFGWLQSEPVGAGGVGLWVSLSALLLFAQALGWAFVLRGAVRLLDSGRLSDLRSQPDEPFSYLRRAIALVRRRRGVVPAPAEPIPINLPE